MKIKLITLLATALFCGGLSAADVRVSWDANAPQEQVSHYKVFTSLNASGPWSEQADVPATSVDLAVPYGTTYFSVIALNTTGSSGPSDVVAYTEAAPPPIPTPPANVVVLKITVNPDGSVDITGSVP